MVCLIAQDNRQALHYARDKNLGKPNECWKYVFDAQDLYGLRDPVIIRLGTWHINSNIDGILDVIEKRNFEILDSNW